MTGFMLSSDELPPRIREIFGCKKNICVQSYFRGGVLLAPERDTYLPGLGRFEGDPVMSVEYFLKFTRENP
jgi:hypothetical protein